MDSPYLKLLPLAALLCATGFAQTNTLTYRPLTAEFSTPLDRIVMVAGNPNAVHIYDPVSKTDVTVILPKPPLSLSLSPDGLHAAVGHDALISYVNLSSATLERTFPVTMTASNVVLSQSWIYVLPLGYNNSVSVNIASGVVTPNPSVFFGGGGRLNTAVNAIYGTRDGTSPNDIEEYTISTGPITRQFDSPYHGDFSICGPVWFSADGSRIYNRCGTVFYASQDPALDMYCLSSIPGISSVGTLAESAALHKLALIQSSTPIYPATTTNDAVVALFGADYLKPLGQFALPDFLVNGSTYKPHGKFVFFNAASTELYVVMQADQNSGLLNDFAVQRISLGAPDPCGAAFASSSATAIGAGSAGAVKITAQAGCIYEASSSAPWLQIVSGGYGSGNGTLTYIVRPNATPAARTATLSLPGQTFTINQDPASAPGAFVPLYYNVVDAAYDKPLDKIIVAAANPDELHIYDPVTSSERIVPLALAPLSISVSPDGLYAAVAHDGWVSYVNVQTGAAEKGFKVITDVHHIVLAGNGYMYLFPGREWSDIYSLEISSGTVTATSAIYNGRVPRLNVSGNYLYVGGSSSSKWDISQGVAKLVNSYFQFSSCGNLWPTEDGRRVFTACAKVYTASEIPAQDLQDNGMFSAASHLVWADESALQQLTAVIPSAALYYITPPPADDTQVQIYGDASLGYLGAVPLPQFTVQGKSFAGHGRFVFWNKAATTLYVVTQADSSANLLAGSAIVTVSPSSATLSPPSVSTISPIGGSGAGQTFTATYFDLAGGGDLGYVTVLFNSTLSGAGGCWIQYFRASNTMYLVNDAGSGLVSGSISPGNAGTLSNSQCTIGDAGSITISGNTLALPVAITFASGFTGLKNVYAGASTNAGLNSNWKTMGTWPIPPPPAVVSVSPINGGGSPQTFTATYSDAVGSWDLSYATLLFNSSLNGARGCWVQYFRDANAVFLINDAGSGAVPGSVMPGYAGTVSNSQCTIGNAGPVTVTTNNLTLRIAITFAAGFTGPKTVYAAASTYAHLDSTWQTMGTWIPAPAQAPSVVSVSPINSSGSPQTFTATYSSIAGGGDLGSVTLLFNSSLNGAGACWIQYLRASNVMYLVNDAGSGLVPGSISPGSPGTLSNAQCTIGNAGAAVISGNTLALPVAVTFASAFSGTKMVYGAASTNAHLDGPWQAMGAWGSGPAQPPSVVSVSPVNGSGSPRTFSAVYASAAGGVDLSYVSLLFNSSLSGAAACWIQYFRASNTMYLVNDAGSGVVAGSIQSGSAGTLSNSQCTISNAGPVPIAGNNLTMPVTVTFAPGFTGTKTVYGAASTNAHLDSVWQSMGTWLTP